MNRDVEKFAGYDAQVLGMSVDSIASHIAWQKREIGWVRFPLGSDFWPHGAVADRYGVLREEEPAAGSSDRALFVIDKQGIIAFSKVYPLKTPPDTEDAFAVLRELQQRKTA
jgi:alkyl hydroperoxide reductase subunit AhpC